MFYYYSCFNHGNHPQQRLIMYCEKCHGKTEVLDSRTSDLRVRRTRRCTLCGRRYHTTEMTNKAWVEYLTESVKKVLKIKD